MAAGTKVQLRLGERVVAEVSFREDALRIGRMKENDLVINNLAVSRFHAVLHREGVAILLVEQNVPLTLEAASRVYIMEKGVVRHQAPAAELRQQHAVIRQYLGV